MSRSRGLYATSHLSQQGPSPPCTAAALSLRGQHCCRPPAHPAAAASSVCPSSAFGADLHWDHLPLPALSGEGDATLCAVSKEGDRGAPSSSPSLFSLSPSQTLSLFSAATALILTLVILSLNQPPACPLPQLLPHMVSVSPCSPEGFLKFTSGDVWVVYRL